VIRLFLAVAVMGTLACKGSAPASPPPPPPAAASPAAGAATAPTVPVGTARVKGRVRFEGAVPSPQPIEMAPECQKLHPEGVLRAPVTVQDGNLADAVVYVKSGFTGTVPPPTQPVVLDQKNCLYTPASVALQVGQPLLIRNSDALAHNVHVRPNQNQEINTAQPKQGMERTETFDKEEALMPVGCDIHPWMRSHVSVFAHPYFAVTRADGTFEIPNLPAGEYVIEAVHPRLPPVSGKATLKDGGSFSLDFAMKR
jgi:plastocyanin